jgi:hypothetical protein
MLDQCNFTVCSIVVRNTVLYLVAPFKVVYSPDFLKCVTVKCEDWCATAYQVSYSSSKLFVSHLNAPTKYSSVLEYYTTTSSTHFVSTV